MRHGNGRKRGDKGCHDMCLAFSKISHNTTCLYMHTHVHPCTHTNTHTERKTRLRQLATELIKCFTRALPCPSPSLAFGAALPPILLPPPSSSLSSLSPLCRFLPLLTCNLMLCLCTKVKSGKQFCMKVFNLCKFCVCAYVRQSLSVCVCVCVLMPASLINFPLTQRKVRIAIFTFKQHIQKKKCKQFKHNTNFAQSTRAKLNEIFMKHTHKENTQTHTHIYKLAIISSFTRCEIESAFVCALCAL